ncbi:hypothetical protein YT1_2658 [Rhodococcus ruber]|nr:hypothetical protein YT1_2658 [Rhodococcus ruber]
MPLTERIAQPALAGPTRRRNGPGRIHQDGSSMPSPADLCVLTMVG